MLPEMSRLGEETNAAIGQKIKAGRKRKNMSQAKLGKLVGVSRNAVSLWEAGNGIASENLKPVSEALDLDFQEMLKLYFSDGANQVQLQGLELLPLLGDVRAGMWLEKEEFDQDVSESVPMVADPRYADHRQFALRVVGTSMDRTVKPGTYVIVAEWVTEGTAGLRDGDMVVVRRHGARGYETTLKRARKKGIAWELWPESTDPDYQSPLTLGDGERDVEVRIIGKVIGRYSTESL